MGCHTVIIIVPLIKNPKNRKYETLYPKKTEYLKNQMPKVANSSKVTNAIHDITGLMMEKIIADL